MTTNHIEHLDPALIRPGRVDHIMTFDYTTKEQIMDMAALWGGKAIPQEEFYTKVKALNIKITASLLQQYFLKYASIDEEDAAASSASATASSASATARAIMDNIDDLKQMYEACNKQQAAKDMYS